MDKWGYHHLERRDKIENSKELLLSLSLPSGNTFEDDINWVYDFLMQKSPDFQKLQKENPQIEKSIILQRFTWSHQLIWRFHMPAGVSEGKSNRVFEEVKFAWVIRIKDNDFLSAQFPELKNLEIPYYSLWENSQFLYPDWANTINKQLIILHPTSLSNVSTLANEAWAVCIGALSLTKWLDRDKTVLEIGGFRGTLRQWDELGSNAASIATLYEHGKELLDFDLFKQDIEMWIWSTYEAFYAEVQNLPYRNDPLNRQYWLNRYFASRIFLQFVPKDIQNSLTEIYKKYNTSFNWVNPSKKEEWGLLVSPFYTEVYSECKKFYQYLKDHPDIQREIAQIYKTQATLFLSWLREYKQKSIQSEVFDDSKQ